MDLESFLKEANPGIIDLESMYDAYQIQDYQLNNPNQVSLKRWEFDYQTRFWYLPSFLSGLVLNANYTMASSEVKNILVR